MKDEKRSSGNITITMGNELKEELKTDAKKVGLTPSSFLRWLYMQWKTTNFT